MFEKIQIDSYLQLMLNKIENNLFAWSNLIELIVFAVLVIASYFLAKFFKKHVDALLDKINPLKERKKQRIIEKLFFPLLLLILIGLYYVTATAFNLPVTIIRILGNLVSAWIVVKTIILFFPRTRMFRFLSALIWLIAALRILNI